MKINKNLNMAVLVESNSLGTIYVHCMPVGRDVFEKYFMVISKTFSEMYSQGMGFVLSSGPKVASLMLKKIATEDGLWDGDGGVCNGLMKEIRRLCNAVIPTDDGWKTMTLSDAIKRELISEESALDVEGAIVFFTCISLMHTPTVLAGVMATIGDIWKIQTTYSNATEFANSLAMSMPVENTGETVKASSIPC